MIQRYQILVAWSPEDGSYVAQVPDLPGCMAHGQTEAEALEEAREAIGLYLDVLAASGGAIPEPREYHLLPA